MRLIDADKEIVKLQEKIKGFQETLNYWKLRLQHDRGNTDVRFKERKTKEMIAAAEEKIKYLESLQETEWGHADGNVKKLLELILQNPDLPVIPFTDSDVVLDDCGYWIGSISRSEINEYIEIPHRVHPIVFKDEGDVFDTLEDILGEEEYGALLEREEDCVPYYDALPWKRAIIVYIGLPEQDQYGGGCHEHKDE